MQPTPGPDSARSPVTTDALVIGAGPVGLFQVFQLGLLGIRAHVVDALPFAGGQCAQLYGDKPIYDIPAVPVCTGHALSERLHAQAQVFAPQYHWSTRLASLRPQADGRLLAQASSGAAWLARSVFITAGAGAFVPRTLKLEGLQALEGRQVFYHQPAPNVPQGGTLVIGHDAEALQRCLDLAALGQPVTLSHRRDHFEAPEDLQHAVRAQCAAGAVALCIGLPERIRTDANGLSGVAFATADGSSRWVDCRHIEAYLGVSPTLAALKEWDIDLDRKLVRIDPATGATSLPGVFAAGDVVSYPGKKKLIVCGFHEACMAAYGAQTHLWPGQNFPLQYTSSSSQLQQWLGVGP